MAEITPRRNGELLREAFKYLMDKPEGARAADVLKTLGERVPMTDFERGEYPSTPGSPRWEKILRFASIATVKAGWLVKGKGIWTLTDEGCKAYARYPDPEEFYRAADRIYREWRSGRPDAVDDSGLDERVERTRVSYEQASDDAWEEISEFLHRIDPYEFQELVADLLRAMGYHVVWVAPRGRTGPDMIAYTDPLGAKPPRIMVEVKRRSEPADVDEIRAFMSRLGDGDVGIFVSSGGFTSVAAEKAREAERRKLTLIDEVRFFTLWVEHFEKLTQEARQRMPIRAIHFLAPDD